MRFLVIFFLFPTLIFCQEYEIIITDNDDNPLIGATATTLQNGNYASDVDGKIYLRLTQFPDVITIQYIGFSDLILQIKSADDIPTRIALQSQNILETMTVTASRHEKRLSESTVSVEILRPELISNTNAISIDETLDKVSGVQLIDGQANIRGGSGYSFGNGSRVMLLVDDIPALQQDAGFPNWGDIPVENIEQIEIVKGASSSLYGSAALNGVINIRTGNPTNTPQTKISAGFFAFDTPQDTAKKWWGDTLRYEYTLSAVHKQKFGKLDVVANFFHYREESYLQSTFEKRYRMGAKLKYQLGPKAFIGLNFLRTTSNNGSFFIWASGDERALMPFPGAASMSASDRTLIDPSLTVEDKYGNIHKVLTRYQNIDNNVDANQSNASNTLYGEYQVQRELPGIDLLVTTGIVGSRTNTDAELFGDTTFNLVNYAYYAQAEKTFYDKLNLSAGIRYEYNEHNTPTSFMGNDLGDGKLSAGRWVSRLGASYEYAPFSALRASWGQGYRFPTISERFITTAFGVFMIASNPDLVPESGWSAEIGIKQGIKLGSITGFVDFALFTSQYEDMMEFTFDFVGFNPTFTVNNVGSTRINGLEMSLFGNANIGDIKVSAFGGYTYIDPQYTNLENNDELLNTLSADVNVLKYRSKHSSKIDLQFDYKQWSLGVSNIYNSHVINIDAVFEGRGFEFVQNPDILGLKEYRTQNDNGWSRWDVRASYQWKAFKFSFLINNVFNQEYTVRPALIEPPRTFSLRLDYTIDWK